MASQTGLNLITDAALISGIVGKGQALDAGDTSLLLRLLNDMVGGWQTSRWMIWRLLELGFTSTGQTTPYTVGVGGNYSVARRPDRLEYAFLRQLQNQGLPVDTPLKVWAAREQYDANSLKKNFVSYTAGVYLDPSWPTGALFCYPWPTASLYQIFIVMKDVLPIFTVQTILDTLPSQYIAAMKYGLAVRARSAYGKGVKPDPTLNALAKSSINIVKNSNLAVPDLVMPPGLANRGNYNIYSDGNT